MENYMKILITGANGYIGKNIVAYLLNQKHDYEVYALDFNNNNIDSRAKFLNIDILSEANNENLFNKLQCPDVIIHLAWKDGFIHNSINHLKYLPAHYDFLKNMIDHGCKSISVMGTMHEIGYYEGEINNDTPCNPMSLYGISKNALRQAMLSYCEDKPMSFKWLRAFYITGDDQNNKSIFSKILEMASKGQKTFPFTSGLNKYDFIDVSTLAQYISEASIQKEINGIINVCSGKPISLKDKVEEFIKQKNLDIRPEYGAYPSRKYDSPAIWGNADLINKIIGK